MLVFLPASQSEPPPPPPPPPLRPLLPCHTPYVLCDLQAADRLALMLLCFVVKPDGQSAPGIPPQAVLWTLDLLQRCHASFWSLLASQRAKWHVMSACYMYSIMVAMLFYSDVEMLRDVQSCSRQAEYAVEGQRAAAELAGAHSQNERLACSQAQAQAICQASDAQLQDLQRQHRKVTLVSFTFHNECPDHSHSHSMVTLIFVIKISPGCVQLLGV